MWISSLLSMHPSIVTVTFSNCDHLQWVILIPSLRSRSAFLRVRRALRPAQQRRRVAGGRQERGGLVEGLGQVVLGWTLRCLNSKENWLKVERLRKNGWN